MNPEVQSLYDFLKESNPQQDFGTVDDFNTFISNEQGSQAIYDYLGNNTDQDLGSIDDFRSFIGFGESAPTEVPAANQEADYSQTFKHSLTVNSESAGDAGARSQYKNPNSGFLGFNKKLENSFGLYQFNLENGELPKFFDWAEDQGIDTPRRDARDIENWFRTEADKDNLGFGKLQEQYVEQNILPKALEKFNGNFNIDQDESVKDLILSTRIQFGQGGLNSILKSIGETSTREEFVQKITAEKIRRFPLTKKRYLNEQATVLASEQLNVGGFSEQQKDVVVLDPDSEPKSVDPQREKNFFDYGPVYWLEDLPGVGGVVDWIDDSARAIASGFDAGQEASSAYELAFGNVSEEDIANYLDKVKESGYNKPSKEMEDFDRVFEESGGGVLGFVKGLWESPTVITEMFITSTAQMLNTKSAIAAGTTVGTITGGGAAFGGVGAVPAFFASIPIAIGVAGGSLEIGASLSEFLREEIEAQGLELNDEGIRRALGDEKAMRNIKKKAVSRGIAIGVIDAFTGKIAGGVVSKGVKAGSSLTKSTAKGLAIESVGGGIGESTARAIVGQEQDVKEIGFEAIGGVGPGAINVISAAVKDRSSYEINGEKVSKETVLDIIADEDTSDEILDTITVVRDGKTQGIIDAKKQRNEILSEMPDDMTDTTKSKLLGLEQERLKLKDKKSKFAKNRLKVVEEQIDTISENYKTNSSAELNAGADASIVTSGSAAPINTGDIGISQSTATRTEQGRQVAPEGEAGVTTSDNTTTNQNVNAQTQSTQTQETKTQSETVQQTNNGQTTNAQPVLETNETTGTEVLNSDVQAPQNSNVDLGPTQGENVANLDISTAKKEVSDTITKVQEQETQIKSQFTAANIESNDNIDFEPKVGDDVVIGDNDYRLAEDGEYYKVSAKTGEPTKQKLSKAKKEDLQTRIENGKSLTPILERLSNGDSPIQVLNDLETELGRPLTEADLPPQVKNRKDIIDTFNDRKANIARRNELQDQISNSENEQVQNTTSTTTGSNTTPTQGVSDQQTTSTSTEPARSAQPSTDGNSTTNTNQNRIIDEKSQEKENKSKPTKERTTTKSKQEGKGKKKEVTDPKDKPIEVPKEQEQSLKDLLDIVEKKKEANKKCPLKGKKKKK